MTVVFYYVCRAGEDPTPDELAHPNAFSTRCQLSGDRSTLVLGDVGRDFPIRSVGEPFSFAFQTNVAGTNHWLHMHHNADHTPVPVLAPGKNQVIMKVIVPAGSEGLGLCTTETRSSFTSVSNDPPGFEGAFHNSDINMQSIMDIRYSVFSFRINV